MTHHRYISIIGFSGLIAWVSWAMVRWRLAPEGAYGTLAIVLFFLTLFIALSATFTVIGFYFRLWLFKNEIFYKHIDIALRQGVFLSLIAIIALAFQAMRVLSWWSGGLLVLVFVLLEFYFSSKDSESSSG